MHWNLRNDVGDAPGDGGGLCSRFLFPGRRTLLLPGPCPRKPSFICCIVNMPWTSVSVPPSFCTIHSFSHLFSLFLMHCNQNSMSRNNFKSATDLILLSSEVSKPGRFLD